MHPPSVYHSFYARQHRYEDENNPEFEECYAYKNLMRIENSDERQKRLEYARRVRIAGIKERNKRKVGKSEAKYRTKEQRGRSTIRTRPAFKCFVCVPNFICCGYTGKVFAKLSNELVTHDHVDSYQELLNKVLK